MPVSTRPLGHNGPPVTEVGLGLMGLSGVYGQKDSAEEISKFLDRAHEIGERFWDTADIYIGSEGHIGEWFKKTGKRSVIFLASKFGVIYEGEDAYKSFRNDAQYVRSACEKSLKRLRVETIDLYYVHRVDAATPIEKTIEAMVELKKEGKIRHIGLSECSAATIRRAHAVHPISAFQVEYNLFCLDIEDPKIDILNTCRELGITIIAYSPVGRGLLTGKIKSFDDFAENDVRRVLPKYQSHNFPKILDLAAKVKAIADKHNASPAQVCIAWVQAQGEDFICIPGTTTIKYLEENTNAASVKLTEDEVKELRRYAEETQISGDKYPAGLMEAILRDSAPL